MYEKTISRSVILLCLTVLLNNVGLSEPKTNRIERVIFFHYFLTNTMLNRTILVIVKNLCWVFNGNIRLESPNSKKGFKNVFIFMYVVLFSFTRSEAKTKNTGPFLFKLTQHLYFKLG